MEAVAEARYPCEMCGKVLSRGNMARHKKIHTDTKQHKCKDCDRLFLRFDHLKNHMTYTHSRKKRFTCDQCGEAFKRQHDLARHQRIHLDGKIHKCGICSQSFAVPDTLKRHMISHTDVKSYSCSICSNSYKQRGSLKKHIEIEHKDNLFVCPHCLKTFKLKQYLSCHIMAVHQNQKGLWCNSCNMVFHRKKSFVKHQKICGVSNLNEPEDPHLYTFTQEEYLSANEEELCCNGCNKVFHKKKSLVKHKKKHNCGISNLNEPEVINDPPLDANEEEFWCNGCNRVFHKNKSLVKHQKKRNCGVSNQNETEVLNDCTFCDKIFRKETEFQKHLKSCFQGQGTISQ